MNSSSRPLQSAHSTASEGERLDFFDPTALARLIGAEPEYSDARRRVSQQVAMRAERFEATLFRLLLKEGVDVAILLSNPALEQRSLEQLLQVILEGAREGSLSLILAVEVLQGVARRGGLTLPGHLVQSLRSETLRQIEAHSQSPSPHELLRWLDVVQDAWRAGKTDAKGLHAALLAQYRHQFQRTGVGGQDPAGQALVRHPSMTPVRAMELLDEYDNETLAHTLAQTAVLHQRPSLVRRIGVRRRLWKYLDNLQVRATLTRYPHAEDFPRLLERLLEKDSAEDQRTVLLSPEIDSEALGWLPDALLVRLLSHPDAEVRLKMVRSVPPTRHPRTPPKGHAPRTERR